MTASEIRASFLEFFREKRHTVVPSASLMPDSPNLLFTNAGMNQFVPIFLGEAAFPHDPARAADTQKCIRAGGKHNDLDDVGLDTHHHTFFEMLGNWSFGDYFKMEAIAWAWELVVGRWGFPPQRLYATIYSPGPGDPAGRDDEVWEHWAGHFREAGLDPDCHIVEGGKKDNFWMMGETGPCGPCSELHVDLTPGGDTRGALVNTDDPRCIEIWNLVFIQFNANPDGTFTPLPARHVDTGMGLERVAAIMQGTKQFSNFADAKISNYETDLFRPIFDEIESLSGRTYLGSLPGETDKYPVHLIEADTAFRVIADHIRTLGFAIADGIQPGNGDRNYVLRRILRRAVRYGRALGFREPFFYKLADVLARTMGDAFPELRARLRHIQDVLLLEEEAFNRTLDKGIEMFEREAGRMTPEDTLSGAFAFRLYDEQGFPLDLTELMARERGLGVDVAGFERLMEQQRARARASQKRQVIELSKVGIHAPTRFVGYDSLRAETRVQEAVSLKDRVAVLLETTPCYAEMGGQVGDRAIISQGASTWTVADTRKVGDAWLHILEGEECPGDGSVVSVIVDAKRRAAIERHHTVTHLLHWAIHEVASREASQKGSYVGADKLTFDFSSAPLTPAQTRDIERLVNERILENAPVTWIETAYDSVRGRPDIQQFFGDKYGDRVRVVQIGGAAGGLDGYSMELCGGTHVRATGELGLFRLLSESAIAAGIRRIEAVCGLRAFELAVADASRLRSLAESLHSPLADLEAKWEAALTHQKSLEKQVAALRGKQAEQTASHLLSKARSGLRFPAIIESLGEADGNTLQAIAEILRGRFEGVVVLLGTEGEAVSLVAAVAPGLVKAVQAGKIIQAIAPTVGGRGGGRPELARGGGKAPAKIPEALTAAESFLK